MTHTITLDQKTEEALTNKAKSLGVSADDLLVRLAVDGTSVEFDEATPSMPNTGAEIMDALLADGVLGSYRDTDVDSLELARQIRGRFQWRQHDV